MKHFAETIAVIALLSLTGVTPAENRQTSGSEPEHVLDACSKDHRVSSTGCLTHDDSRMVAGAFDLQH